MSVNCANSSSTATLFLLEKKKSSMLPLFLRSLEYSLCLLSLTWDNLYSLPFDYGFFTICPLLKLLWLSWTSLFCLSRSSFVDVSQLEGLISTSIIIWKISSITLMHSNWCCVWLICTNYIISSCNLVLLLELLHLLQRHLSDQVYKLLQCNFILLYVIVQRVKVSVAILTDLNLLSYQTAIIQWQNFNKDMYKL